MSKVVITLNTFTSELIVKIGDKYESRMNVDKRMVIIKEILDYDVEDHMVAYLTNNGTDYLSLEDLVFDDENYKRITSDTAEKLYDILDSITVGDIELHGGDEGVFRSIRVDAVYQTDLFDNIQGIQFVLLKKSETDKLGVLRYIGFENDKIIETLLRTLREEKTEGCLDIVYNNHHRIEKI